MSKPQAEDITLVEFMQLMKEDVETFGINWMNNHGNKPKDWPLSMSHADWHEQFLCVLNGEGAA